MASWEEAKEEVLRSQQPLTKINWDEFPVTRGLLNEAPIRELQAMEHRLAISGNRFIEIGLKTEVDGVPGMDRLTSIRLTAPIIVNMDLYTKSLVNLLERFPRQPNEIDQKSQDVLSLMALVVSSDTAKEIMMPAIDQCGNQIRFRVVFILGDSLRPFHYHRSFDIGLVKSNVNIPEVDSRFQWQELVVSGNSKTDRAIALAKWIQTQTHGSIIHLGNTANVPDGQPVDPASTLYDNLLNPFLNERSGDRDEHHDEAAEDENENEEDEEYEAMDAEEDHFGPAMPVQPPNPQVKLTSPVQPETSKSAASSPIKIPATSDTPTDQDKIDAREILQNYKRSDYSALLRELTRQSKEFTSEEVQQGVHDATPSATGLEPTTAQSETHVNEDIALKNAEELREPDGLRIPLPQSPQPVPLLERVLAENDDLRIWLMITGYHDAQNRASKLKKYHEWVALNKEYDATPSATGLESTTVQSETLDTAARPVTPPRNSNDVEKDIVPKDTKELRKVDGLLRIPILQSIIKVVFEMTSEDFPEVTDHINAVKPMLKLILDEVQEQMLKTTRRRERDECDPEERDAGGGFAQSNENAETATMDGTSEQGGQNEAEGEGVKNGNKRRRSRKHGAKSGASTSNDAQDE